MAPASHHAAPESRRQITGRPSDVAERPRFVAYLRVSTAKQGASGLGLEAQRQAVARYVASVQPGQFLSDQGQPGPHRESLRGETPCLLAEYVETESGRKDARPRLQEAIRHARNAGAVLIIAKLDRLSRDVHFLTGLEKAGVEFVACDMPKANRLTITILAAVAQHEAELISERTKAALQVAGMRVRKHGQAKHPEVKRLGNPNGAECLKGRGNKEAVAAIVAKADATAERLKPELGALRAQGITSLRGMAMALNARGIMTPRGARWNAKAVSRVLARLD